MRCEEACRQLEEALGPGDRSLALRNHLAGCPACRAYAERLESLDVGLREAGAVAPAVDEGAFAAGVVARLGTGRPRRRIVRWAVPAAAAVVLAAVGVAWLARPSQPPATPQGVEPRVVVTLSQPPPARARAEAVRLSGVAGFAAMERAERPAAELDELADLPGSF